ncbi:MAG: hypothetical protein DI547_09525 [Sphingobium sp.]|nr:MAG: hypothetical protein DI547_09525 [Sphingobium sp.]
MFARAPLLAPSLLSLALAACVAPRSPAPSAPLPAPSPAPAPAAPAPAATADWQDAPLTPGDWIYRPGPDGPVAQFGPAGSAPLLSVRCARATRQVVVARTGASMPANAPMIVRTTFGAVQWPTTPDGASMPHVLATRAAGDAALDQIAFSRGRFAIEVAGLPRVVVPAWPEIARVVEDCRG